MLQQLWNVLLRDVVPALCHGTGAVYRSGRRGGHLYDGYIRNRYPKHDRFQHDGVTGTANRRQRDNVVCWVFIVPRRVQRTRSVQETRRNPPRLRQRSARGLPRRMLLFAVQLVPNV